MRKKTVELDLKTKQTESSLIEELNKGNKEAFRLLFEKYGKRLYHFSLKYLRDKEDSEDLLNEVFLKIWENRGTLKTNTSFQAYLFTIAYNNIRKRFLKKSKEEKYIQIFAEEYISESSNNEDSLDYLQFINKIEKIVNLLPPRRKEIFNLSYKEELNNEEIADKLGISIQFVKNQLSIARKFIVDKTKADNHLAGVLLFYLFAGQTSD